MQWEITSETKPLFTAMHQMKQEYLLLALHYSENPTQAHFKSLGKHPISTACLDTPFRFFHI